jgi:hypothetical protein
VNVNTLRLVAASTVAVVSTSVALSACGPKAGETGDLARNKQLLTTCPKDKKVAAKVDIDVSGSGRADQLGPERTAVVETIARRTAVCGGHLRISAFSVTSAATVALYDEEISLPGATVNARLNRVQAAVDAVSQTTAAAYPAALKTLSPNGSDILGQYRLAGEYKRQLGDGYHLELLILSDGYQAGDGISLGGSALTREQAAKIADKALLPKLPDASITVAGIGKITTGKPSASAIVNGVAWFWDAVCKRTGASSCSSVTDYTTPGR